LTSGSTMANGMLTYEWENRLVSIIIHLYQQQMNAKGNDVRKITKNEFKNMYTPLLYIIVCSKFR